MLRAIKDLFAELRAAFTPVRYSRECAMDDDGWDKIGDFLQTVRKRWNLRTR